MIYPEFCLLVESRLDPIKKKNPYFNYSIYHDIIYGFHELNITCRIPMFECGQIYKFEKIGIMMVITPDDIKDFSDKIIEMIYIDNVLEELQKSIGDIYLNQNLVKYQREVTKKE